MTSQHDRQGGGIRRRSAFTLIEIMVVIGIIVLLVSLLVPMVMRSYRAAGRARAQADLRAIEMAIEAYRQDFGDIPRTDPTSKNHGAAVLGKALLGPYGDGRQASNPGAADNADPPVYNAVAYGAGEAFRASADGPTYVTLVNCEPPHSYTEQTIFVYFPVHDGADGPGFRKRIGSAGPVSPAYLSADKVAVRGIYLLDHYGNPILYFPANTRKRDLTTAAASGGDRQPYVDQAPTLVTALPPLYSADDNFESFARRGGNGARLSAEVSPTGDPVVLNRVRIMLGDSNANGYIDQGETAVTSNFLLWSAGPDGLFGPTVAVPANVTTEGPDLQRAVSRTDDVMNFRQ